MRKIFVTVKWILIALIAAVTTIMCCDTYLNNKKVEQSFMDAGPQKIKITPGTLDITKPLKIQPVAVLHNVELCDPVRTFDGERGIYPASSECSNGSCVSRIDIRGMLITYLGYGKKENGKCVYHGIEHVLAEATQEYVGDVNINPDLAAQLGIENVESVGPARNDDSHFAAMNFIKNGNDTTIMLYYPANPPTGDEFMFGGKRVKIHYNDVAKQ